MDNEIAKPGIIIFFLCATFHVRAGSEVVVPVQESVQVRVPERTLERKPVTLSKEMRSYLSRQYNDPLLVNKFVSLTLKDASVREAIELIGKTAGFNFLIDPDVKGHIPLLHFRDVPLSIVLRHILQSNIPRLALVRDCELFRVTRLRPAKAVILGQQEEDFISSVISLSHVILSEKQKKLVEKLWRGILGNYFSKPGFYMFFDEDSKKIFCRGQKGQVEQFKKFLKEIDFDMPQIKIEARFVCAEKGFEENIGFQLSGIYNRRASISRGFSLVGGGKPLSDISNNPTQQTQASLVDWALNFLPTPEKAAKNFRLPFIFGGNDLNTKRLNLVLNAAENRNEIKTILNPTVLTNDGEPAEILVGENIPIERFIEESVEGRLRNFRTAVYKDIGIQLKVRPTVAPDKKSVLLDIFIENSQQSDSVTTDDLTYPVIRTTRSHTKIRLKSGHTTKISGLHEDIKETYKTRAPFLSSIPFLGSLFRGSRNKIRDMQLLIFITATVV